VIPYTINAAAWADHARGERFLAMPGNRAIKRDERGRWMFPEGSVLVKTVSLELERGKPESQRRLETQVLHREGETWRAYTYAWNEEQTDATLADAQGVSQTLAVRDGSAPGGRREQVYRIAGRKECLLCHNPWVEHETVRFGRQSASPLGVGEAQLNVNGQLERWGRQGLFEGPLPSPAELPRLADPYDDARDVEHRARAYFQVNCAHCHQEGAGGTTTIRLAVDVRRAEMRAIGARPVQGTFGLDDARIIAPGDPDGSVLLYRMGKLGGGRMPRVGSSCVDVAGVKLIADWIKQLPGDGQARPDPVAVVGRDGPAALPRLLDSTRGALGLMRAIDAGLLTEPLRGEVVAMSKTHPRAEVRDLFERFVPDAERVRRLGEQIDPAVILAVRGDAARGRSLFVDDATARCKTCHRVGGAGETLGPDLSHIGGKYARAELLRQILEPSQAIDARFTAYLVEAKDGRVYSGLLVARNEREVVLRDAQNETVRLPAAEVEQLAPQPKSLMPEGAFRDLTLQQAADLLEFLMSLK
jgi:uncharacterized repeat protein (TIGR03806 family)